MLIDAHVHLFPERLAEAIRGWFDAHAWHVVHSPGPQDALDALVAGGADRVVALPYVHKPGMAASLNAFTRSLADRNSRIIPCCTVFPGEDGAEKLLDDALGAGGFAGVKIHCHVMRVAPDDPRMDAVWRACARHRKPLVIHAGLEPASPGYGMDVHTITGAARVRAALERHPDAVAIVPHLGADEFSVFERLLDELPNLHLDSAMALAGYFPRKPDLEMLRRHPDRILFGTDYPNLPYPLARELDVVRSLGLPPEDEAKILGGNAARLFGA